MDSRLRGNDAETAGIGRDKPTRLTANLTRLRAALLLALALVALAACGKKAAPRPPGPADQVTYPRVYPAY
jgi:hypothetical protein